MSFVGNTCNLPTIYNYEKAETYFNNTRKPRTQRWERHQRPLRDTASKNYRIEKGLDFYDLILYNTALGRYYKPTKTDEGQDIRRVCYANWPSATTRGFMMNVLRWGMYGGVDKRQTTDGREVAVPTYTYPNMRGEFCVDLLLVDGKVDTSKSRHTPHYRTVITNAGRKERKDIKETFKNLIMMAQMRAQAGYYNDVELDFDVGRAFAGVLVRKNYVQIRDWSTSGVVDAEGFLAICDSIYIACASNKGIRAGLKVRGKWRSTRASITVDDMGEHAVTPNEFKQAIERHLVKAVDTIDKGKNTKNVEQPQFMDWDKYPKSNIGTAE